MSRGCPQRRLCGRHIAYRLLDAGNVRLRQSEEILSHCQFPDAVGKKGKACHVHVSNHQGGIVTVWEVVYNGLDGLNHELQVTVQFVAQPRSQGVHVGAFVDESFADLADAVAQLDVVLERKLRRRIMNS